MQRNKKKQTEQKTKKGNSSNKGEDGEWREGET